MAAANWREVSVIDSLYGAHGTADLGGDWFSAFEHVGHWSPYDAHSREIVHHGQSDVVGTPDVDAADWIHQTTPFTCAVVSQEMILKEYGVNVSEAQLVYDAMSHGWLHADGTSPFDAGHLLEYYGVNCHMQPGGDVDQLLAELAHGHKVIAAVDSGALCKTDWFFDHWFTPHGADHAVVVTGLDMRNPDHPLIVLNDPGDLHGAGKAYPLDEFLHAWAEGGDFYLATDHAPAELASDPVFGPNFHSDTGLYLDIAFWTAFLASLFVASTTDLHAAHEGLWAGARYSGPSLTSDAWAALDDAGRNGLFYAI
jgi:hypothetical protein